MFVIEFYDFQVLWVLLVPFVVLFLDFSRFLGFYAAHHNVVPKEIGIGTVSAAASGC